MFSPSNKTRKRNKKATSRKRDTNSQIIPVCRCYDLYFKDPTRKVLCLINTFIKEAVCKINKQKSVAFPYSNNEHAEKENRKTLPFTIA
jgi:hypothetical protein